MSKTMRNRLMASAVIFTIGWWFPGDTSGAPPPRVRLRSQLSARWCWAASAEMVLAAFGTPGSFSQGRQVERLRRLAPGHCSKNVCADDITPEGCDESGFPQFYKYGLDTEVTRPLAHLAWKELATELQCRPVAFAWENRDEHGRRTGNGHMVVFSAAGFVTLHLPGGVVLPLGPWLVVDDPLSILDRGLCRGNLRGQTYADYLRYTAWIHYYGFRDVGDPYTACELDAAESRALAGWPEPVYGVLESFDPQALVDRFIALLNAGQGVEAENGEADQALEWLRSAAGLEGRATWECDSAHPIVEEALSISALKNAGDGDALGDLVFDTGRRRYLCTQGQQTFSIEVAKDRSDAWQIATVGDVALTSAIRDAQALPGIAETLREVYVQGLNLKLLRDPGPGLHRVVVPLSPMEDLAQSGEGDNGVEEDEGVDEARFLAALRRAARTFVSNGPS